MRPADPSPVTDTPDPPPVDVAVAVIRRPDGQVLFAQRPPGTLCAGYWEFPGGKIEADESARAGLVREIDEELGLHIRTARPWITLHHDYPHARVRLHFFIVTGWSGEPHPHEGQKLAWQDPAHLAITPMLAANAPVLRSLQLPEIYAISQVEALGEDRFIERLDAAVRQGLRLLQLREKSLSACRLKRLTDRVLEITAPAGARVLVNSAMPAERRRYAGVHLTSRDLMRAAVKPDHPLVAASCHDRRELDHAIRLGLDFVVVSPVLPTGSHPGAAVLGATGLRELLHDCPLPVYALGGMTPDLLGKMQSLGAHGIAMLSAAWQTTTGVHRLGS